MYLVLREDEDVADAVAQAIDELMDDSLIYWPAPLELTALPKAAAKRGIRVVGEIYPDTQYAPDGALILERAKKFTDPTAAAGQVTRFIQEGSVRANDGSAVSLEAESVCVHGDGPNAIDVVRAIHDAIASCGWSVAAVRPSTLVGSPNES